MKKSEPSKTEGVSHVAHQRLVMRDYRFVEYFIAPNGELWHGPFCPYDNLHYKLVGTNVVTHSDLPPNCVEITPQQAAMTLARQDNEMKILKASLDGKMRKVKLG